jgi:hypothetical protein
MSDQANDSDDGEEKPADFYDQLGYTDAQKMAINNIQHLLREHFDHGVIAIETLVEGAHNSEQRSSAVYFHGPRIMCIGLGHIIIKRLME